MSRAHAALALTASALLVVAVSPSATSAAQGAAYDNGIELVSVAAPEVYPDSDGSLARAISDDGRYVVFSSDQPHLTADPPPVGGRYFYLRDLVAGTTVLVGRDVDGSYPGNAAISRDGRYVVFPSQDSATDQAVVRLFDRTTGRTRVIAESAAPVSAGVDWYTVAISDNGRSIVYTRSAQKDGVLVTEMFHYDVATRTTTQPLAGNLAGPSAFTHQRLSLAAADLAISADGRYVVLPMPTGPGPAAVPFELVRLDLTTGQRLVLDTSPPQYYPREVFGHPTISNTGRFVAAYRLGGPDGPQVYLHDATKGRSTLVSHNADGAPSSASASEPKVSGDGAYVSFISSGRDLAPGLRGGIWATYLWERATGTIQAPIRNLRGSYPHSYTAGSTMGYLDRHGATMAFSATSANLVPGADNRLERVYVWRR